MVKRKSASAWLCFTVDLQFGVLSQRSSMIRAPWLEIIRLCTWGYRLYCGCIPIRIYTYRYRYIEICGLRKELDVVVVASFFGVKTPQFHLRRQPLFLCQSKPLLLLEHYGCQDQILMWLTNSYQWRRHHSVATTVKNSPKLHAIRRNQYSVCVFALITQYGNSSFQDLSSIALCNIVSVYRQWCNTHELTQSRSRCHSCPTMWVLSHGGLHNDSILAKNLDDLQHAQPWSTYFIGHEFQSTL